MKRLSTWILMFALTMSPAALFGCEQRTPAEEAVEDMGDRIEDATDDAGDRVEDLGDQIEDATDN